MGHDDADLRPGGEHVGQWFEHLHLERTEPVDGDRWLGIGKLHI
jgi:hypothetical protein